jgi:hypothetical protein
MNLGAAGGAERLRSKACAWPLKKSFRILRKVAGFTRINSEFSVLLNQVRAVAYASGEGRGVIRDVHRIACHASGGGDLLPALFDLVEEPLDQIPMSPCGTSRRSAAMRGLVAVEGIADSRDGPLVADAT